VTAEPSILQAGHAGYPQRLRALDIDRTLHVRGVLAAGPALAIVGARAASQHAMERAHAWAKHAAARGVNVVSGGALGIDGAAHRGALEAMASARQSAGSTTAVLGTGIDVLYPARHAPLFEQIVRAGGALVSMFPRRAEPRPWMFTARNTLISALADVVIVVEADVRSGSLSTALAAQKQGRVVAAYPGSRGCRALLARGCAIVENERDVLALVAGDARYPAPVILDETACRVREAIAAGARDVDAIVRHTGLSVRVVLRALPQLESLARLQ
jgi:DNA processing protein